MKVSVVIPTYNRAYIISDALASALNQTYRNFEVIVVDDGSTDNTKDVIERFGQEHIRYMRFEKNRGLSAALNAGVAAASGDLVALLDSDDTWTQDKLERQVALFSSHPEVDAVFSDAELVDELGPAGAIVGFMTFFPHLLDADRGRKEYVFSSRQMYLCLLREVPIKPTTFMAKRQIFQRVGGFDEGWPSGMDWEFFLRLSRSACFGYVDLALARQRRLPDSTFLRFVEQDKVCLLKLFRREKATLRNDSEALAAVNRGIALHARSLGGHYVYLGRRKESSAVYFQGFTDTREPVLLLRAATVWLPLGVRQLLRRLLGRGPRDGSGATRKSTPSTAEAEGGK